MLCIHSPALTPAPGYSVDLLSYLSSRWRFRSIHPASLSFTKPHAGSCPGPLPCCSLHLGYLNDLLLRSGLCSNVTSSERSSLLIYLQGSLNSVTLHPLALGTCSSLTLPQLSTASAWDSLPKSFLWPKGCVHPCRRGSPQPKAGGS